MTLVLTELSEAGIAMAADSAITQVRNGRIVSTDSEGWDKLIRVPRITAAASYWGHVGQVTHRFDLWLREVIRSSDYSDLASFADVLADALNAACGGEPLDEGQDTGIHVAGYAEWEDGEPRPYFFHVHNGHGTTRIQEKQDHKGRLIEVRAEWVSDPRKLFEKHQDFPKRSESIEENVQRLKGGYTTRNGDYLLYAVIWRGLTGALNYINLMPDASIPRDPTSVASRKGFLHVVLETMIRLYGCSNRSRVIGGDVTSLGIAPGRYVT